MNEDGIGGQLQTGDRGLGKNGQVELSTARATSDVLRDRLSAWISTRWVDVKYDHVHANFLPGFMQTSVRFSLVPLFLLIYPPLLSIRGMAGIGRLACFNTDPPAGVNFQRMAGTKVDVDP